MSKNAIVRTAAAPLATPLVAPTTVELEDAFDDDSLAMNEAGDKFRVAKYHRAHRLIGVTEQEVSSTSFTVIAGCTCAIPERTSNKFYWFRALLIYLSSDVAEGCAARVRFSGTLFGQHRYRVLIGDSITPLAKCRFDDLLSSPASETGGPGPLAFAYQELEGAFSAAAGSSGDLTLEVAAETGGANSVTAKVGTILEVREA